MKLHELKASTLLDLWPCANAEEIMVHHGLRHYSVDVDDDFEVGNFSGWSGSYWIHENRTGILYYATSITAVKEWIKTCRAALDEEQAQ